MKQNIQDLNAMIVETKKRHDDNTSFIEHKRNEVIRLRDTQMKLIEAGFDDVIKKLEEKRDRLKESFRGKYDTQEKVFDEKLTDL